MGFRASSRRPIAISGVLAACAALLSGTAAVAHGTPPPSDPAIRIFYPKYVGAIGGTVFVSAAVTTDDPDPGSVTWTVEDQTGQLSVSGTGTTIAAQWNTRGFPAGQNQLTFTAQDSFGQVTRTRTTIIDHALHANPHVTQVSHHPDTLPPALDGDLFMGAERVWPFADGNTVTFLGNFETADPATVRRPILPICQNCEVYTVNSDGTNMQRWTFGGSEPSTDFWKAERISADRIGKWIAFTSSADLVGRNPWGAMQVYVLNTHRNTIRQLTHITQGIYRIITERVNISADGQWIAFGSEANLLRTNPQNRRQLYVMDRRGRNKRQFTFGTDGDVRWPVLSGNGWWIVFCSDQNPFGTNPNHIYQLFIAKRDGTELRQLTFDPVIWAVRPAINHSGSKIVYGEAPNFTIGPGARNLGRGEQIVTINNDGTGRFVYTNISTHYLNFRPDISADGRVIAWESTADLVPGGNADRSREIFASHVDQTDIEQLTSFEVTGGGMSSGGHRPVTLLCQRPYLNGDGSMVGFEGTADLVGQNPGLWLQVYTSPTWP